VSRPAADLRLQFILKSADVPGVLTKISLGTDGLTNLVEVCEGTNVSDINYYLARKRPVNDFHGIGAFLIMNEFLRTSAGGQEPKLDWTAK